MILSSKKKMGFLSDPKYMGYKGFQTVDTAEPYFEVVNRNWTRRCKPAGIKSRPEHYRYKKPGGPHRAYPDLILARLNIDGLMQCIVSDMTAFRLKGVYHELALYMDLWNNEILSHPLSAKRGDRMTYASGLDDLSLQVSIYRVKILKKKRLPASNFSMRNGRHIHRDI